MRPEHHFLCNQQQTKKVRNFAILRLIQHTTSARLGGDQKKSPEHNSASHICYPLYKQMFLRGREKIRTCLVLLSIVGVLSSWRGTVSSWDSRRVIHLICSLCLLHVSTQNLPTFYMLFILTHIQHFYMLISQM